MPPWMWPPEPVIRKSKATAGGGTDATQASPPVLEPQQLAARETLCDCILG